MSNLMLAKILIVDRTSPASSYHGYTQQQQQQQVCLTLRWSSVVFALGLLMEKKPIVMSYLKVT